MSCSRAWSCPVSAASWKTAVRLIATDLDDAAAMKKRAEDAGAAYEKALAEARSRAQILAQETRSKLAAESDAKRKVLEADLGQRLAEAEVNDRGQESRRPWATSAAIADRHRGCHRRTSDRQGAEHADDRSRSRQRQGLRNSRCLPAQNFGLPSRFSSSGA